MQGLAPVREVLELAQRIAKLEDRALKLWVCDCIRRLRSSAELREHLHALEQQAETSGTGLAKPSVVGSLMSSSGPQLTNCGQLLALARRYFDGGDLDLIYFAHQARLLELPQKPTEWPSAYDPWRRSEVPQHQLANEEKWQAEQLLTRLDMMPTCADLLVRLDYAEFNGKAPVAPFVRERFDELRTLALAGRDTPVQLILEFLPIIFDLELRSHASA